VPVEPLSLLRPVQPHFCSVFPQLACVFFMISHCLECTLLINIFSKNCKFLSCLTQVHQDTSVWTYNDTACRNCTEHM
jgi:hypothetical protein